jgi:predicted secreted protein
MIHGAVLVSAYLILWFLALFCILPIGLSGNVDSESGAPARPTIVRKMLIATAIASVLWLGFYASILFGVFDL